ncbi:MAG: HD domain-containing protein [Bacteroidota bacterium]
MQTTEAQASVEEIFSLFEHYGEEEYGENLSQSEHMIQSALLAQEEKQTEEVIIAALLHDIGHLYGHQLESQRMGDFGVVDHESLGAEYLLSKGFSHKVATLVEGHVLAKRYLCYVNPEYLSNLSQASMETLKQQGGPMNKEEAARFRLSPYFELSIRMRHWDEEAKIPELKIPPIESYREMLLRHLQ